MSYFKNSKIPKIKLKPTRPRSTKISEKQSIGITYMLQAQVQNFIQKTFSGYMQVAYEKKEEQ